MDLFHNYSPQYAQSRALIVGVNTYQHAAPLGYARQDAEGFAEVLETRFGFEAENISLLLDEQATRDAIRASFLSFSEEHVSSDDRIVVFFAGHGDTRSGHRGEIGFLVPVDGDPHDLSTLIRWDELTRNAELVPAKHVLFLMDACYGGLALRRSLRPGSTRFLRNMMQRFSRQVLTAGKADETVADAGGPRPNHSIFTGHLLDALEGGAADPSGIISANGVMAYVYERVGKDPNSQQSPHFGFLEGDGDFIFHAPTIACVEDERGEDDLLIQVPAIAAASETATDIQLLSARIKDYLTDDRYRIRLEDLVSLEIRGAARKLRVEEFPVQGIAVTAESFAFRLAAYESAVHRIAVALILICRWGTEHHALVAQKVLIRLTEEIESQSGSTIWLSMRWYPILLLFSYGSMAAISSSNYRMFALLTQTRLGDSRTGRTSQNLIQALNEGLSNIEQSEMFKKIPGHERFFTAKSEYLFKALQPLMDETLDLGRSYEDIFDRFEVLYALEYADTKRRNDQRLWGPIGRFGWKGRHYSENSPLLHIEAEATEAGDDWEPLKAGLFKNSLSQFNQTLAGMKVLVDSLGWY